MGQLGPQGVKVSLFSSRSITCSTQHFPVTALSIDQSIILHLLSYREKLAIVAMMALMADLGLMAGMVLMAREVRRG